MSPEPALAGMIRQLLGGMALLDGRIGQLERAVGVALRRTDMTRQHQADQRSQGPSLFAPYTPWSMP